MLIHAFKRKEPTPIELFGLNIEFKPNAQGHCVAEVDDEAAIDRLLSISEAYREYEAPAEEPAVSMVFTNGLGETLDISKFTAKQTREFAADNAIELPGGAIPVAELRKALAKALADKG